MLSRENYERLNSYKFKIVFGLILLFSIFIRTYRLNNIPNGLFTDEIFSVYDPYLFQMGKQSLSYSSILSYLLQGTYFTYAFTGPSIFFIRLPAAIYGILLVPLVYFLGKEMFNVRVGLLSAILMALSPWAVIFSRYQVPSMSYVFYFVLSLCLFLKGKKVEIKEIKSVYYLIGSLVLGLVLNTMVSARIFIPLFLLGILIINLKDIKNFIYTNLENFCAFLLTAYPVILGYVSASKSPVITISNSYSIFNHATSLFDIIILIVNRVYLHFSINFLILDGGLSFTNASGFSEYISSEGILKYSTTVVGMLNYYGVLIYPALLFIIYKIIKRFISIGDKIIVIWIISYAIASGIAYFDNPNAARNIIGLPALIISIGAFVDHIYKNINNSNSKKILIFIISILILLPSIYFLNDYFNQYPLRSERAFDYGYEPVAVFLKQNNLWCGKIYLHDEWGRDITLASYSPIQPYNNVNRISDFSMINFNDANNAILITRFSDDIFKFNQIGVKYIIIKKIYYSDNTLAFLIIQIKNQN
jgi:uncharacterized membrane protein